MCVNVDVYILALETVGGVQEGKQSGRGNLGALAFANNTVTTFLKKEKAQMGA